jgi:hypothetical protein
VWTEVSNRYVDIDRHNMEQNMRENILVALHNGLRNNWEKGIYIKVCTREARRGKEWWNLGILKLGY